MPTCWCDTDCVNVDADEDCERKANDSQCVTDSRYMLSYCRRTCTQCAAQQPGISVLCMSFTCYHHQCSIAFQLFLYRLYFTWNATTQHQQMNTNNCKKENLVNDNEKRKIVRLKKTKIATIRQ